MGTMGSGMSSASPGAVGRGVPVPAARMERTSAARHRPKATARSKAATSARPAVGGLEAGQLGELDAEPGDPGRGRAAQERLGRRARGRRTLSPAAVTGRTARRGRSGRAPP